MEGLKALIVYLSKYNVLISIFCFDIEAYSVIKYCSPSDLLEKLDDFDCNGSKNAKLSVAIETITQIIDEEQSVSNISPDWLQYIMIFAKENIKYPSVEINKLITIKNKKGINMYFNAITLVLDNLMLKVASMFNGVYYTVKKEDYKDMFIEALMNDNN